MTKKSKLQESLFPRKEHTPAFKVEGVRQVATGARRSSVALAQVTPPALLGRWPRQVLKAAVPSSAERDKIKQLRNGLRRVETARDILKKAGTIFSQPPPPCAAMPLPWPAPRPGRCSSCAGCWP